ncbi:MAG: hypothetical protein ACYCUV_12405 [Phycisphaerae bacterium]
MGNRDIGSGLDNRCRFLENPTAVYFQAVAESFMPSISIVCRRENRDLSKGSSVTTTTQRHNGAPNAATYNVQRTTFFANFNLLKMLKLGGQGAQVEQVDVSLDFSGFGSRRLGVCPSNPWDWDGPEMLRMRGGALM